MSDAEDINTLIPLDAPCLWLSRDVTRGEALRVVDVWTASPHRTRSTVVGLVTVVYHRRLDLDTYVGRFTVEQIRQRFGIVPLGDECIVIDNPKVN